MGPFVLDVYKDSGVWVLDDPAHRLEGEPLLFGMEQLIDRFAETLPYAEQGFELSISDGLMGDEMGVLIREEADAGGHWYRSPHFGLRGWLGNRGLLRYFSTAPAAIYYAARPRSREPSTAV